MKIVDHFGPLTRLFLTSSLLTLVAIGPALGQATLTIDPPDEYQEETNFTLPPLRPLPSGTNAALGDLLRQGQQAINQGNFPQAIAVYQQAIQLDPDNGDLHGSLGYLHSRQGQFAEAVQQFQRALSIEPNNPEFYDGLGFSYANLGQLGAAASAYSNAIGLAPREVKYHLALGIVLLRQGDYERVRQIYDDITRLQPGNEAATVMMGAALLQSGQWDQTITFSRQALQYFPQRSEFYLQMATAYLQQGNPAAARQILEPRLRTDWRSVALPLLWAQVMEAEQNYPEALQAYKQALRNDPQAIAAKVGTGRMYLALGQGRDALWIFQDLTRQDGNNGDFYDFLGQAYMAQNQPEAARTAWTQAQALYKTQNNREGLERVAAQLNALN